MITCDVGIIGLGAMGSAVSWQLAKRGARVVGFDRLAPPHTMGSSHGRTRIIREAYYEHPLYVPLVQRAFAMWEQLEAASGASLLKQTGGLMAGREGSALLRGAMQSASRHNIAHEMLDAAAIARRFPAYQPSRITVGLFEPRAGMLFPEKCIEAQLAQARAHGADLRLNETVNEWSVTGGGSRVVLKTTGGEYRMDRVVIAAGPWLPTLLSRHGLQLPLEIERQLSHWFEPADDARAKYGAEQCPIALWEMPDGDVFATLPDIGDGVKCGMHHGGPPTSPDDVNRMVSPGENAVARELLETVMPGAGGRLLDARVCLYTNTPDRHFLIDWLQGDRVLVLSPCSGHGFKFAPAIGEIAAELCVSGKTWLDLHPFALRRLHV